MADERETTDGARPPFSEAVTTGGEGGGGSGRPGDRIGPYRLLELLGEGGFGVVWLAEQTEPVRRRVALKVIKPGMDSKAVIARFEAERQALAMMSHPGIAKVLDAGTTERRLPYFVMEHVKGSPITAYCDQQRQTIEQRLKLFAQVCDAVQHAHMKGIIHRDLKPSNILVTVAESGEAHPVVIDFGVAKALASRLTEQTIFTERGQLIGTPEYMSPEQAEMSEADIDTRTDVYSLGVILYELLTGGVPFDSRSLRAAGIAAIQKMIREQDPPRPSTRLTTLGEASAAVASARQIRLEELASTLRRELEWIPLKALRKDRTERYRSASHLADDVGNYLAHRPLVAGPESAAYRARKFVRRNKGAVGAAAAVLAAGALGVVGIVWQAKVARDQRDRAVEAETQATLRADELQKVSDFQAKMLEQVDPTEAGRLLTADVRARYEVALAKAGVEERERSERSAAFASEWARVNATDAARELIDRTILRPAVAAIDQEFKDQPVVDARLRQVLASLYHAIGLYDAAFPLQEAALATRRRVLGEEHPDTLTSLRATGLLLKDQGKLAEAEAYCREALEKCRRVLGEEHEDTLTSTNNMGYVLQARDKLSEAERYHREALEKRRRVLGEEHPSTLTSMNNMGLLLRSQGKYKEAEPYYREALERRRRVLGEEHPSTLRSINNMGYLLEVQGRFGEAESYYREELEKCRRVMGEEHPETLISISNMGNLLRGMGKDAEAEPYYREALEKRRRVLGEEHPHTLTSFTTMGYLLKDQGKYAEAEECFREALEKRRRVLGEEHVDTLTSINNMGELFRAQGKDAKAEPYYREALEKRRRVLGDEHPSTLTSINNMGYLLQAQGQFSEAEPYYRDALEKRRRVLGEEHPHTLLSLANMGSLLQDQGQLAEAERYYREALEKRRRVLGDEHRSTLASINIMGYLLKDQGKYAEAEPYYREALEKRRRVLGEEHPSTLTSISNMGELLQSLGRLSEAESFYRDALDKRRRVLGEEHPDTLTAINNMGFLLQAQGQFSEAEPYYRDALEKRRRVLGEEHPHTLLSLANMGSLLQDQGQLAEAERYYREALEKRRRVLGEEHPDTLTSLNNLGMLLEAQGRLVEAEPYLREALEKSRRVQGGEHPTTLSIAGNFGRLLHQLGKHQEALDLLVPIEPAARTVFTGDKARRLAGILAALGRARIGMGFDAARFALAEANLLEAYPIFVAAKDRGPGHKDTLECVRALIDLYRAWDAVEPGKGFAAKAADWKAKLEAAGAAAPKEPAAEKK